MNTVVQADLNSDQARYDWGTTKSAPSLREQTRSDDHIPQRKL